MFHKIGKLGTGANFNLKSWVAAFLFGMIIVVMALFGVQNDRAGDSAGGVAAVVNDRAISIAEYRTVVENIEQNANLQFSQFPEEQRRRFTQQMRQRALEELIFKEMVFQVASKRGLRAADGEVRDTILQVPFFQENGRFMKDRYRMYLQSLNMTSEDFERRVRRELVGQKMQELFVGSAAPTREELRRKRLLANQKVNLKYIEITQDDFKKPGLISADEVKAYLAAQKSTVEKYYNDNAIEFTEEERIRARHIFVRIDDKRPEAEAKKLAETIRKDLTPANFAKMAAQHSDDPSTKNKGGDVGELKPGQSIPEVRAAALKLGEGQISDPIQTTFGYHIVMVDKKVPPTKRPLSDVETEIARKLLAKEKQPQLVSQLRSIVEKGNKSEIDAWASRAGLKWQESGEFDLSSVMIPKLGDSQAVVGAVLRKGKGGGMVPQLIENSGRYVIADVVSWKEVPDKAAEVEGTDRMVAYRKSSDLFETWVKQVEASASVQRNPRLLQ